MTRETKIGLLVGLAFIVVFAMLLSHTGTVTPPGDGLQFVNKTRVESPTASAERPEPQVELPPVSTSDGGQSASPAEPVVNKPQPTTPLVELPRPSILNPSVSEPLSTPLVSSPPDEPGGLSSETSPLAGARAERMAPTIPEQIPEPVANPRITTPTPTPAPVEPVQPAQPTITVVEASKPATVPGSTPKEKEYVVKKGQNLLAIAREVYGEAYAAAPKKVTDFIMASNKIKNRHLLVEGQKILTPALPPEVFEPKTDLNVGRSSDITASLDRLINGPDGPDVRQAPAVKSPADKKPAVATANPDATTSKPRTYVVKSNDTFSSIAKDVFGSESAWREIQKINKDVDPAKMKPGTVIKLPTRKTSSDAGSSGKNSV